MRHLSTLALAGLFGGLLFTADASACHKKKAAACECPAPAPVVACPPPALVVCEAPVKKKHHMKMPKMKLGCHKKAAAECAPVAYEAASAYAPVYAAPQASPQASHQGM